MDMDVSPDEPMNPAMLIGLAMPPPVMSQWTEFDPHTCGG